LILDELADYVDVQEMEALRCAIDRFGGGVILVTENEQLRALATEKWFMDEGVLHVEQLAKVDARSNAKTSPGEAERRHIVDIERRIQ